MQARNRAKTAKLLGEICASVVAEPGDTFEHNVADMNVAANAAMQAGEHAWELDQMTTFFRLRKPRTPHATGSSNRSVA